MTSTVLKFTVLQISSRSLHLHLFLPMITFFNWQSHVMQGVSRDARGGFKENVSNNKMNISWLEKPVSYFKYNCLAYVPFLSLIMAFSIHNIPFYQWDSVLSWSRPLSGQRSIWLQTEWSKLFLQASTGSRTYAPGRTGGLCRRTFNGKEQLQIN